MHNYDELRNVITEYFFGFFVVFFYVYLHFFRFQTHTDVQIAHCLYTVRRRWRGERDLLEFARDARDIFYIIPTREKRTDCVNVYLYLCEFVCVCDGNAVADICTFFFFNRPSRDYFE